MSQSKNTRLFEALDHFLCGLKDRSEMSLSYIENWALTDSDPLHKVDEEKKFEDRTVVPISK